MDAVGRDVMEVGCAYTYAQSHSEFRSIKHHLPPVSSHGNALMASPHQHSTLKTAKACPRGTVRKFFSNFPACLSLLKENLLFGAASTDLGMKMLWSNPGFI